VIILLLHLIKLKLFFINLILELVQPHRSQHPYLLFDSLHIHLLLVDDALLGLLVTGSFVIAILFNYFFALLATRLNMVFKFLPKFVLLWR
jgi:hypothetical protein